MSEQQPTHDAASGALCPPPVKDRTTELDKWRQLIEVVPTAIIMANQADEIVLLNTTVEQLFGYQRVELIGRPIALLLALRCRASHIQNVREFFSSPYTTEPGVPLELSGLRKDGIEFPVEIALIPTEIDNDRFALAALTDITRRTQRQSESRAAQLIQQALLPKKAPIRVGMDCAGSCIQANETGGDFFDYVESSSGSMAFIVGDVSGHGFGPALLAATAKCSIRSLLRTQYDIGVVLAITNDLLCAESEEGRFVTLFILELDAAARSLSYCGAGHDAYILCATGEVKHLDAAGLPLGLVGDEDFVPSARVSLNPGDGGVPASQKSLPVRGSLLPGASSE